jgi:hypothetical protein
MREVQDIRAKMFLLYGGNKFKALRQIAFFPLFSMGYDALNLVQGLKAGLRQVLRRAKCLFYMGLSINALKSQSKVRGEHDG